MVHARAAGDRVTEGELLGLISACNALGPTPLDEGIAQSDAILDDARATGNRRLEQSVLRSVGTMYSMKGAFDRARSLIADGRALAQELGLPIDYWAAAQNAGRNEWLAGDLDCGCGDPARELRGARVARRIRVPVHALDDARGARGRARQPQ